MRKEERVELAKLNDGYDGRLPGEVITRFVPCVNGKNGQHGVTLVTSRAVDTKFGTTILGITCECEGTSKEELDALKRLGGYTCLAVMEATKARNCLGASGDETRSALDLGYDRNRRVRDLRNWHQENAALKFVAEAKNVRWGRLYSILARKHAGAGFYGLHVVWKYGSADVLEANEELRLQYGRTHVASRVSGQWRFNDAVLAKELEYSDGNRGCEQERGRCLVCAKNFIHFEPHLRHSRHIGKLLEGFKRAMWGMRKKAVGRFAHPEGGWK